MPDRRDFYLFTGIEQCGARVRLHDNEDYGERDHVYPSEEEASAAFDRICQALRAVRDSLVAEGWEDMEE